MAQALLLLCADVEPAPLVLAYFVVGALLRDHGDELFQGFAQLLSLVPGFSGNFLRRGFYSRTLIALRMP